MYHVMNIPSVQSSNEDYTFDLFVVTTMNKKYISFDTCQIYWSGYTCILK